MVEFPELLVPGCGERVVARGMGEGIEPVEVLAVEGPCQGGFSGSDVLVQVAECVSCVPNAFSEKSLAVCLEDPVGTAVSNGVV